MSVTTTEDTSVEGNVEATGRPDRTPPRWRAPVLWTAFLLVAAAILAALTLSTPPEATAFDPEARTATGSAALARVLADRGVDVDVVRTIGGLEDADANASTTVVITGTERLGPDAADRLLDATQGAARVVLVVPRQSALNALEVPATTRVRRVQGTDADCELPILRSGERLGDAERSFELDSGDDWRGCFPGGTSHGLLVHGLGSGHETWVLGFGAILQNQSILQEANAAAAVRLLGHDERLVWYHPGALDAATNDEPRGLQFPPWFTPLVTVLTLSVGLLALIRGRRLGRVVTEPLPVVVRASETTEGRGRLYRRAGDRAASARILRAGTTHRLARRLGLDRSGDEGTDALVDAVARSGGESAHRIRALLLDPVEDTDQALITLAQQLTELEEKVAQP